MKLVEGEAYSVIMQNADDGTMYEDQELRYSPNSEHEDGKTHWTTVDGDPVDPAWVVTVIR